MNRSFDTGLFLISLDFELYWGVRDKRSLESYGQNLRNTRKAVQALLSLFQEFEIRATWATVGLLFHQDREAALTSIPSTRPEYLDQNLCPFQYLQSSRELEREVHFALELINKIADTPGQEIATHTYSHFYCLEKEVTSGSFRADLEMAIQVASRQGLSTKSLVFPRNQWRKDFLPVLKDLGIDCYRGVETHPAYQPTPESEKRLIHRAIRLADSYLNLTGHHTFDSSRCGNEAPYNLPASRFLRPYSPTLAALEPWRQKRIVGSLYHAAQAKECFHLWWHPHNFGRHLEHNLAFLRRILEEYQRLSQDYGLRSLTMAELAEQLAGPSGID